MSYFLLSPLSGEKLFQREEKGREQGHAYVSLISLWVCNPGGLCLSPHDICYFASTLLPRGLSPHWHISLFIFLRGRDEHHESREAERACICILCLFSLSRLLPLYPASPWMLRGSKESSADCRERGLHPPVPRECHCLHLARAHLLSGAVDACTAQSLPLFFHSFMQPVLKSAFLGFPAAGSALALSQIGCLPSLTELTTWVVYVTGRGIPSRARE